MGATKGLLEEGSVAKRAEITSVCVVGLGNVGGATAKYFASQRVPTYGCDLNPRAADAMKGVLTETATNLAELPLADMYIVAVDTGFRGEEPVTSSVFRACNAIAMRGTPKLVSIESTLPIGTCNEVREHVFHGKQRIVHVPHRWWFEDEANHGVRQTRVVGGSDPIALRMAVDFYGSLGIPLIPVRDPRVAELAKAAENTDRYLKIAYAELLKMICDDNDIDFEELRLAMNSKWNVDVLEAREGIGGTCLPKDILYVKAASPERCHLLDGARAVDEQYRETLSEDLYGVV